MKLGRATGTGTSHAGKSGRCRGRKEPHRPGPAAAASGRAPSVMAAGRPEARVGPAAAMRPAMPSRFTDPVTPGALSEFSATNLPISAGRPGGSGAAGPSDASSNGRRGGIGTARPNCTGGSIGWIAAMTVGGGVWG